jgi:hypothetical protein
VNLSNCRRGMATNELPKWEKQFFTVRRPGWIPAANRAFFVGARGRPPHRGRIRRRRFRDGIRSCLAILAQHPGEGDSSGGEGGRANAAQRELRPPGGGCEDSVWRVLAQRELRPPGGDSPSRGSFGLPFALRPPPSAVCAPPSVFRLPPSVFRLPPSVFRPPSSVFRPLRCPNTAHLHALTPWP